jgi:hypothetical protein
MIGNPYQMTRSDAGNKKGWYLLDFESGEDKFIENSYSPKFVRIHLDKFLEKTIEELKAVCLNNRVDLYVPSSFLIKYQINPVIDILSQIAKKLEVIPFEDDLEYQEELTEENSESFNIYGLCEKYVKGTNLDPSVKERVLTKINGLYTNILKDIKE